MMASVIKRNSSVRNDAKVLEQIPPFWGQVLLSFLRPLYQSVGYSMLDHFIVFSIRTYGIIATNQE